MQTVVDARPYPPPSSRIPWQADGTLCMDIIQDKWSPIHNVCSILTSVQSLLTDPNPASPANPDAARLFTQSLTEYNRRVRRIAQKSVEE